MKSYKISLFLVFGFLFWSIKGVSQDVIPTKGKEFWVGFMENYENDANESLDLFITSDQNTSGTVSIPLQGWTIDFNVDANVTTTVTIPNNLAEHSDENQIISAKGIFVETEDTVSVFAINFVPFTADGTKILPTKALGTDYSVSSYTGLAGLGSELLIVATEDDTEVEITPSVTTENGDPAGVPFLVNLDRGQSYQIKQDGSNDDLTGTTIIGTESSGPCRPFAVFSGVSCTNVPVGCTFCDHIFEQNFPTNTWGTEYYLVPYEFATGVTYRVLALEDGTQITVNGGAPINLNAGEYFEDNQVNVASCIQANSPVSVTQYMQGTSCSGSGDPAMLILNDASQKIDNVTFSTVVSAQISDHGINVILATQDVGSFTIDGTVVDAAEFSQFPSCPENSFAQLSITQGSHTLNAPNGFTAYAFGLGNAESYSYSVGSFSPNPFGDIEITDAVCSNDEVVLAAEDPGFGTFWYNYDFPDDTLALGPSLTLEPPIISGIYVATYNTLLSGCEQTEYFSVEVPDPPILTSLTQDQTICQYESVQLSVAPEPANSFYQYSWTPQIGLSNPFIPNPVATPLSTTTYTVTVTSPTGCSTASSEVSITVEGGDYSNLNVYSSDYDICSGETTQLFAEINEVFFEDNFDPGISWGLWNGINNGLESLDCGSITGNALYFNGFGDRSATTIPLDVSAGGAISFALKYGEGAFPCDDVDAGEDVILEYSTNGTAWNPVQTFFSFAQTDWDQFSIEIPAAAESATTQFRWRQLASSGANEDNWSLDNVAISVVSTAGLSFDWYNTDGLVVTDDADPVVTPLEDMMYVVEANDANTGCLYTDSVFISVGQNFTLDITPDTVLCDIQGIEIHAIPSTNDAFDYLWSPNDTSISSIYSGSPTVTPSTTTTYSVEVTSDQGCVNTADVTISVNQLLDLNVFADDDEICLGESTFLNANVGGNPAGIEYLWTPSNVLDDATSSNPEVTPTSSTVFEVTATDSGTGCALQDEVTVDVSGAFSIDAGPDVSTCDAAGLELIATPSALGAYTWSWSPAFEVSSSNTPNTTVLNNTSNEFIVSATEDNCTQTDTVSVNVIFENFDLGPDLEICQGESVDLNTGFIDAIHDWNTGESTETISVSEEQQYSVTITSGLGCDVTDNVFVTVHDLPTVDLGPDQELCVGENLDLSASNFGSDYLWSTSEVSETINVMATDTYSVVVTDLNECQNSDEIDVIFHENPLAVLPPDSTICEDQFITLNAQNPGATYLWSPGNVQTQTFEVNLPNTYTLEITNSEGCTTIDDFELTTATYPVVNLGPDISACELETEILNANAAVGLNVNWNTGETSNSIAVNSTGEYEVVVDNSYCFSSDVVTVFFSPQPENNLPEEIVTCFVEQVGPEYLDAGNLGSSYIWSNGSTSSNISVYDPGTYSVEVTTAFGCDSTFSTDVVELCYGEYIYVPNSFTPNSDSQNEGWRAEGIFIMDFHVQVYNRWGEVIFESVDVDEYWTGNDENGNHYVTPGVYTYRIRYKYVLNEFGTISDWTSKVGTITVAR